MDKNTTSVQKKQDIKNTLLAVIMVRSLNIYKPVYAVI